MTVFYKDDIYILHVHVPRTGGGSIFRYFQRHGFNVELLDISNIHHGFNAVRKCSPQHYHAAILESVLKIEQFNYVFMTVRNPIDRVKSEFIWRNRGPRYDASRWINEILDKYDSNNFLLDNHIRPQHEFWLKEADLIRSETNVLKALSLGIKLKLGLSLEPSEADMINVAKTFDVKTVGDIKIDPNIEKRVRDFYRLDFEKFDYEHEQCR